MQYLNLFLGNPLKIGLIMAILALGVFIAYRVLDVADLSVEGVFPLTGLITVMMLNANIHPLLSTLIALLLGAACGAITACLRLYLKIPSLLAGIIVMTILIPIVTVFSAGSMPVNDGISTIYTPFTSSAIPAPWNYIILNAIIVLVVLALIYLFFGTELGAAIRATGKNVTMSKAQGINTNVMIIIGMAISSALIGLSGSLYSQVQNVATSDAGRGMIVLGLTIIFLGEAIFRKRSFLNNIISIVLGGITYYIFAGLILQIPGFNATYLQIIQAVIIIAIVAVPLVKKPVTKFVNKRRKSNA